MKQHFNIVKTAEGGMTTYQVDSFESENLNAAICAALTEAAKDVWPHVAVPCGTYSAADLSKTGPNSVYKQANDDFPKQLQSIAIVCGVWKCCIEYVSKNLDVLFRTIAKFETLASVKQADRLTLTKAMELGKLVCEAHVVLPSDMKTICACCGDDPLRPMLSYPAIDLDRRCIVATDGALLVAKKFTLGYIHYEDKVPETFYLPKEVARMQGEVTVQLYERGCTIIAQDGVSYSVEHEARYPRWYSVWPKWHGGMTIVDSKAMTKVVKGVVNGLPERGKGSCELLMVNHYAASANLCIRGYDGAEMKTEQRICDCVATDEVPYRLTVDSGRLLKALALKPKTMQLGYSDYSTLPNRLVLEDLQAGMAILICERVNEELQEALRDTESGYAVTDTRRLHNGYGKDGWLLEQMETKYPGSGKAPEPVKPTKQPTAKKTAKRVPTAVRQPVPKAKPIVTPLSLADRLRAALRARMAQAA